jgi:hypothetical protein
MMPFREWLDETYTAHAAQYRMDLQVIVRTCHEYSNGNIWESKHTMLAIELLNEVKSPVLGKYPGEVSAENREWYKTCVKPEYLVMMMEAINELPKIKE